MSEAHNRDADSRSQPATQASQFLEMLQGPLYVEGYSNLHMHTEHVTYLKEQSESRQMEIASGLATWLLHFKHKRDQPVGQTYRGKTDHRMQSRVSSAVQFLMRKKLPWTSERLLPILELSTAVGRPDVGIRPNDIVKAVGVLATSNNLTPDVRAGINKLVAHWQRRYTSNEKQRTTLDKLKAFVDDTELILPVSEGTPWTDRLLSDFASLDSEQQIALCALLNHCKTSAGSVPSLTWLKQAGGLGDALGVAMVEQLILNWFPLVDASDGRLDPTTNDSFGLRYLYRPSFDQVHVDILKGLSWMCASSDNPNIARALGALAIDAYRRIPNWGDGARSVRLGNAAIWALGQMQQAEAVNQLVLLQVQIKSGSAQKQIEIALDG